MSFFGRSATQRAFDVIQQPPAASHKSRTAEDQVRSALDDPGAALLDGDEALTVQADACCEESEAVFGEPFVSAETDCLVHVGPLAEVETTHRLLEALKIPQEQGQRVLTCVATGTRLDS
jgi:hypothetical protein